jgi:hypothetical protein
MTLAQFVNAQVDVSGAHAGSNGSYPTVKEAFDAINLQDQTGFNILVGISDNTTETASAVLNAGAWATLTITPTTPGKTIAGEIATSPLLDINGADNVTFDGGSGKGLTLRNTNATAANTGPTIRFSGDATGDVVTNCIIENNTAASAIGAIQAGPGTNSVIISNCDIRDATAGTTGSPYNAVYTETGANALSITSCNIFNWSTTGLELNSLTDGCTISNNHFYQESAAPNSQTAISLSTGNGHLISGNFIGGSAPSAGGTAWGCVNSNLATFVGIYIAAGSATSTSVQNNTIRNFHWTTNYQAATATGSWCGLCILGGSVLVGTVTGNTIGGPEIDNITLEGAGTSNQSWLTGIYSLYANVIQIANNTISGISVINSLPASACTFYGINAFGGSTVKVNNNLIGSETVAQSISTGTSGITTGATINLCINSSATSKEISQNTISNISSLGFGTAGITRGINVLPAGSASTITGNIIKNLTDAGTRTGTASNAELIGISHAGAGSFVSENTIYNLNSTAATAAVKVYGIYSSSGTTATDISRNRIYSINLATTSTAAILQGMYLTGSTNTNNNMIALGDGITNDIQILGIQVLGIISNGNHNVYFNSVKIGGSGVVSGVNKTYAFYYTSGVTKNIKNNLFINARSNASTGGKHYAVGLSNLTTLFMDYNLMLASGTGGILGYYGGDISDLPTWRTTTGQDANSVSKDVTFASSTDMHLSGASMGDADLFGIAAGSITTDFDNENKSTVHPFKGADEGYHNSWTGSHGTDWTDVLNWSLGSIPTASENIFISDAALTPVLSTGVTANCDKLLIADNAGMVISAGGALTVSGTLTKSANPAELIIESGGSLIHNSNDVAATVKLQITGSSTLTLNKYHFVAIPTQYATPTTNLFLGSYIYKLDPLQQIDPPTNPAYGNWVGLGTSTTTPLMLNQGYMIYYPGNSHEYTFTGNLNNGTFNYSLVGHSGTDVYTYNLVPNPYPSSLVWNTADAAWTKSAGIGGTCYIWNAATGNYTNLASSATSYIPVGQAMMVLAVDEALPTLSVNNNARSHSSQAFYKSGGIENLLTIKATANGYADETVVHFIGEATEGFDLQVDGMKLQGLEDAPQLYTLSADKKFSINNLPLFQDQRNVDLNFETQFTGPVSFTISGIESFNPSINICLKDELTSQTINLRNQQVYTFSHNPENAANRFKLVFGGTIGIDETPADAGKMWIAGNTVYINAPELNGQNALMEVFNVAGQRLLSKPVIFEQHFALALNLKGFVIVKLTCGNEVMTVKGILMK